MNSINNLSLLKKNIKRLLNKNPSFRIISIDGWTGSGKSTVIAPLINKITGWTILDGDTDFLIEGKGAYIFDNRKIKEKLSGTEKIIIDSILALRIFAVAKIRPDISIYVKKVKSDGYWLHEHIVDIRSSFKKLQDYYKSPLDRQLLLYLRNLRPDTKADIVYLNHDPFNDIETSMPEMFFE